MRVALTEVSGALDKLLNIGEFSDLSHNGLQISNNGFVSRVLTGVDASLRLLEEAARRGADCVVCHHGLSWGDSLKRITGINYRLVSFAIRHDIAVYGVHLPLDAHPVYGNNAQLCKVLGLAAPQPAFRYHGQTIGYIADCVPDIDVECFNERVRERVNPNIKTLTFGKKNIKRVGIVSGGAADLAEEAAALGADLFLTGEPTLQGYNLAEHLGLNVVFAGHYATERWGVVALAQWLEQEFKLTAEFADFAIDY